MARLIDLILHLFWLTGAINFRKVYSPPLVRHLHPTPRGMGTLLRLHIRISSSWDGELATHVDFLPWVDCNNMGFHATKNMSFLKNFLQCVTHVVARYNLSQPKENLLINCYIHIDMLPTSYILYNLI